MTITPKKTLWRFASMCTAVAILSAVGGDWEMVALFAVGGILFVAASIQHEPEAPAGGFQKPEE